MGPQLPLGTRVVTISMPTHERSRGYYVWAAVAAAALLGAATVVALALGALRDPTESVHGMLGSALWTTVGPHLVLLSGLALGVCMVARRRGPRRLSVLAGVVAAFALVASVGISARIILAVRAAGGTASPVTGLWLGSMTAASPNATVTLAHVGTRALQAAVFTPSRHAGRAPVLVYVHGGGFMAGSLLETAADLRWFADRGWLVVSLDYRLWPEGEPTWAQAPADVACGIAWVHANAARFGGDTGRIALLGDSAGGSLVINHAYAVAQAPVSTPCGEVTGPPAAVVVQYPAVDPLAIYEHGYPVGGFEPKMLLTGYIGGSPYAFADRVRAISAYSYLSGRAPATLVLAPEKDGLVPAWSVYRFADHARLAGVDIELVRIPFANHVYNQLAANSIGNQARRSLTARYLARRGLGPG